MNKIRKDNKIIIPQNYQIFGHIELEPDLFYNLFKTPNSKNKQFEYIWKFNVYDNFLGIGIYNTHTININNFFERIHSFPFTLFGEQSIWGIWQLWCEFHKDKIRIEHNLVIR